MGLRKKLFSTKEMPGRNIGALLGMIFNHAAGKDASRLVRQPNSRLAQRTNSTSEIKYHMTITWR